MQKIALFSLFAAVLIAPVVLAEGTLTDSQMDMIRTNCVSAQINLQRVQDTDKRTRISRGHWYESTLHLMANLNSRIAQNKINAPEMLTIVSDYQDTWDEFRSEYIKYDDEMTALIATNCQQEPTTFNDRLTDVRAKRQVLSMYVTTFDELLDRYQKGLDTLKTQVGTTK